MAPHAIQPLLVRDVSLALSLIQPQHGRFTAEEAAYPTHAAL